MSRQRFAQITTPATPPGGTLELFYSSVLAALSIVDSTGVVTPVAPATCKLIADTTAITSAALANVTGLVFPVTSGIYYHFLFHLLFQGSNVAVQPTFALTTPTFTRFAARASIPVAADGTASEFQGTINTSADKVIGTAVAVINVDYLAVVEGTILPSANGNLQVQAANNAGANNLLVRQGSNGMLWVIP